MDMIKKLLTAGVACSLAVPLFGQVSVESISPNTPYYIKNVTSGMVLNNGGSLNNGTPITQWNQVTSDNLLWTLIPTSGGYYQIQSVKSGLDINVAGAATTNGAPLIQ